MVEHIAALWTGEGLAAPGLPPGQEHGPGSDPRLPEPDLDAGGDGDGSEAGGASSGQAYQAVR